MEQQAQAVDSNPASAKTLGQSDPLLRVENIKKNYGGLRAVQGVSFTVAEGGITGLIGPNGAGKTTIFNIIAGEQLPSSGEVFLGNQKITGLSTDQLYHMGLMRTFQLSHEYPRMTSLENLMVAGADQVGENIFNNWFSRRKVAASEKIVEERARDALEFLGLTHVTHELAGNLSGGQKKLLELGRTMMNDSRLVLLDEPGAGVNPTLVLEIIEMIRRLNKERGYTFCIIEHDMDLIADLCDNTIVLSEGKILTQGSMEDIRRDERVIDAYFGGDEV